MSGHWSPEDVPAGKGWGPGPSPGEHQHEGRAGGLLGSAQPGARGSGEADEWEGLLPSPPTAGGQRWPLSSGGRGQGLGHGGGRYGWVLGVSRG